MKTTNGCLLLGTLMQMSMAQPPHSAAVVTLESSSRTAECDATECDRVSRKRHRSPERQASNGGDDSSKKARGDVQLSCACSRRGD